MNSKNWNDIYQYWITQDVPNMTFMKFEFGKHSPHSPWFEKKHQSQFYFSDNPILNTGAHLGRHLRNKPQELIDAYKIFAFLRYKELLGLFDIVKDPFKKHNEDFSGWWNANARNIFPYYESINNYHEINNFKTPKNIKTIIDAAAQTWKDIANEWALIIIPGYMDRDSEEYNEYWKKINKAVDDKEYAEYLRLKEKFENKSIQTDKE
ncbi:MAG: hypothetical protein QM731_00065 [Chitinophagaceae bacterium]